MQHKVTGLLILIALLFFGEGQPTLAQTEDDPPAQTPNNDFYGVNFVAPYEPWLSLARDAGVGVVRWQFNWRDHEIAPGQWAWEASDGPVQTWNQNGFKVHAILHNPPDWARANPGGLVPTGIDLPWNDPGNGFGRYCNLFAQRYRGKIDSYEVWNEPDLDQYWEGTPREYFNLLKSCYQGIKAADPNATVSMAGMAILIEPNFYPEVIRIAANDAGAAANNAYFDAMSIHMYAAPQLGYDLTVQVRQTLANYGMSNKPIWITEMGVALRGYGIAPNEPQWGMRRKMRRAGIC